ncbi:MAG: TetR/AcrR family transcriptional regulator [Spirochaetales bacterium]|nr:TetR/AcrR family transcriptional regulator [Spirochaetales bacterium]
MAKQKFEREEIIEKSKELFWNKGYSSSSMQDVIKTTGLKPGSIYNSFGNKEALYSEALENYTCTNMEQMRQRIESAPSIGEGICAVLENLILQSEKEDYSACFLIKTQFEITEKEGPLHDQAVEGLERVEEILSGYLIKEYGEELGAIRATSVMLHMNGIRVYSYRKNALERMRLGVREGTSWLPWDEFYSS